MGEDGFMNLVTKFRLSGSGLNSAVAVVSPPRPPASSGLLLRPRQPNADEDDDSTDDAKLAWKAWMKEHITISEGIQCDVLAWWKDNASRFPLIAKAAKIVLATPAS